MQVLRFINYEDYSLNKRVFSYQFYNYISAYLVTNFNYISAYLVTNFNYISAYLVTNFIII